MHLRYRISALESSLAGILMAAIIQVPDKRKFFLQKIQIKCRKNDVCWLKCEQRTERQRHDLVIEVFSNQEPKHQKKTIEFKMNSDLTPAQKRKPNEIHFVIVPELRKKHFVKSKNKPSRGNAYFEKHQIITWQQLSNKIPELQAFINSIYQEWDTISCEEIVSAIKAIDGNSRSHENKEKMGVLQSFLIRVEELLSQDVEIGKKWKWKDSWCRLRPKNGRSGYGWNFSRGRNGQEIWFGISWNKKFEWQFQIGESKWSPKSSSFLSAQGVTKTICNELKKIDER